MHIQDGDSSGFIICRLTFFYAKLDRNLTDENETKIFVAFCQLKLSDN